MAVLLKILLKSAHASARNRARSGEGRGIHQLTEVVLPVLGFAQLILERLKTVVGAADETDTFEVRHAVAFRVVDAVRQVDFVGEQGRLRGSQGDDGRLYR